MAAAYKDVTVRVWLETRHHEDDPAVAPQDWRDPSKWVDIENSRMVSGDAAWRGHEQGTAVEPNWDLGCWLEGPGASQPHLIEFSGHPGEPFASALLNGLVGKGVICFEDQARHN